MSNIDPEKNKRRGDDNNEELQPEKKKTRLDDKNKQKCPHCSKIYAQSSQLNRHIKAHHAENNSFSCNQCSKQFIRKEYLQKHKCFPKCPRCANEFSTKKTTLKACM